MAECTSLASGPSATETDSTSISAAVRVAAAADRSRAAAAGAAVITANISRELHRCPSAARYGKAVSINPSRRAFGHGLATRDEHGVVLDVYYPGPALGEPDEDGLKPPPELAELGGTDRLREVSTELVLTQIDL